MLQSYLNPSNKLKKFNERWKKWPIQKSVTVTKFEILFNVNSKI